jgi:hypothetical protein
LVEAIAEGRRHRAEGRRQKLRKSRVSTIKNVLITLAVAITLQNLESHIISLDFSIGFHGIGNWKLVTYTTLDYVKNSYPLPMPYLV